MSDRRRGALEPGSRLHSRPPVSHGRPWERLPVIPIMPPELGPATRQDRISGQISVRPKRSSVSAKPSRSSQPPIPPRSTAHRHGGIRPSKRIWARRNPGDVEVGSRPKSLGERPTGDRSQRQRTRLRPSSPYADATRHASKKNPTSLSGGRILDIEELTLNDAGQGFRESQAFLAIRRRRAAAPTRPAPARSAGAGTGTL